jgi:hypothetical protein
MPEQEMLDLASRFSPYRYVALRCVHLRGPLLLSCAVLHTHYIQSKKYHANTHSKCLRSLFMWYMWRIEDVDISVLQQ